MFKWESHLEEGSIRYTLSIEAQLDGMRNAMAAMEDEVVQKSVVEYLKAKGWTVEPPRGAQ